MVKKIGILWVVSIPDFFHFQSSSFLLLSEDKEVTFVVHIDAIQYRIHSCLYSSENGYKSLVFIAIFLYEMSSFWNSSLNCLLCFWCYCLFRKWFVKEWNEGVEILSRCVGRVIHFLVLQEEIIQHRGDFLVP